MQALEVGLAPGDEHLLAAADPAVEAEDEVGELAGAVGGASMPARPRPPRTRRLPVDDA